MAAKATPESAPIAVPASVFEVPGQLQHNAWARVRAARRARVGAHARVRACARARVCVPVTPHACSRGCACAWVCVRVGARACAPARVYWFVPAARVCAVRAYAHPSICMCSLPARAPTCMRANTRASVHAITQLSPSDARQVCLSTGRAGWL
jgi:hypothetical protein